MTDKQKLQERLTQEILKIEYTNVETCINKFDKLLSEEEKNSYIFSIDFQTKEVHVIER